MRNFMMTVLLAATACVAGIPSVAAAALSASVHKDSVTAYAEPSFDASTVATLSRGDTVQVADQDGLWYQLALDGGMAGYVRVNDIRVASSSNAAEAGNAMHVLLSGKSSRGRVTETAGVRGLGESELRSASFDAQQLARMQGYRASADEAADYARRHGWSSTRVAWEGEAGPVGVSVGDRVKNSVGLSAIGSLLGSIGGSLFGSAADVAQEAAPKSEMELLQIELALGPMIAGRVLGARPLWQNPAAQRRVNLIGRWLADQSSRPDLPWTFGVIDSPEYNAFAAPGGYVMVTRGLYELVGSDAELASVLAHEITHIVQRDHYAVVRDQGMMSSAIGAVSGEVNIGGGLATSLASDYVEEFGASVLVTGLDREAEYRADAIAQVYLARAGMNPLAMYGLLQKMAAVGTPDGGLAQLYATHPSTAERLDRIDSRRYDVLQPYLDRPVSQGNG